MIYQDGTSVGTSDTYNRAEPLAHNNTNSQVPTTLLGIITPVKSCPINKHLLLKHMHENMTNCPEVGDTPDITQQISKKKSSLTTFTNYSGARKSAINVISQWHPSTLNSS